jgi:hypothetical protein
MRLRDEKLNLAWSVEPKTRGYSKLHLWFESYHTYDPVLSQPTYYSRAGILVLNAREYEWPLFCSPPAGFLAQRMVGYHVTQVVSILCSSRDAVLDQAQVPSKSRNAM